MKRSLCWGALILLGCGGEDPGANAGVDAGADAAGGSAGSSSDGGLADSARGPGDDIDAFCDKLAALPCGKTRQQCLDDASALIDESAQKGCSAEYSALLACGASGSMQCTAGGGIALPDCAPELAALDACDPPSVDCVGADVPGISCSKSCAGWGAACSETPQGLECSCTVGPHAGEAFSLPGTCVPSWSVEAQQKCQ